MYGSLLRPLWIPLELLKSYVIMDHTWISDGWYL